MAQFLINKWLNFYLRNTIGFILYYAFASEFVLGGIEAIGIDLDGEYFSILAFPLSIVLLIPLIWLDERRSKKKHRK